MGLFLIAPVMSFAILNFSPKSPVWLLSYNKQNEALEALNVLRGQKNQEIINFEFKQIQDNLTAQQTHSVENWVQKLKKNVSLLIDPTFIKPFFVLLLLFPIGMSWSGLISIGFYMVPLLQSANISMNSYWANTIIQTVRAVISILGIFFNKNVKRRPVYIGCCVMSCLGTLSLAFYYYWNVDGALKDSWFSWTPILSVLLVYVAYGLGLGSIPIMLQVRTYIVSKC